MSTNPAAVRELQSDVSSAPADDYIALTINGSAISGGVVRFISCDADGFLNVTNPAGAERENVQVFKGYNPISCTAVDVPTTGSAPAVVWGYR
jgi:hypothetical protein